MTEIIVQNVVFAYIVGVCHQWKIKVIDRWRIQNPLDRRIPWVDPMKMVPKTAEVFGVRLDYHDCDPGWADYDRQQRWRALDQAEDELRERAPFYGRSGSVSGKYIGSTYVTERIFWDLWRIHAKLFIAWCEETNPVIDSTFLHALREEGHRLMDHSNSDQLMQSFLKYCQRRVIEYHSNNHWETPSDKIRRREAMRSMIGDKLPKDLRNLVADYLPGPVCLDGLPGVKVDLTVV